MINNKLNIQIRFAVEDSPEADLVLLMPADKAGAFMTKVAELALAESVKFLKQ